MFLGKGVKCKSLLEEFFSGNRASAMLVTRWSYKNFFSCLTKEHNKSYFAAFKERLDRSILPHGALCVKYF